MPPEKEVAPAPTYDLMEELKLFKPKEVRFFFDAFDELHLEYSDGQQHGPLSLRRAFPLSDDGEFISLRDEKGGEIGIVRHLDALDADSRDAIKKELERKYFSPQITAIHSIETKNHIPRWHVETDRGPRHFELHSSRRDLRVLPQGRVLIRDADGNRFEIPDYRRLDNASRALVAPLV